MENKEICIFYCETERHNQGLEILEYTTKNLDYAKKQFEKCKNCYMVKTKFEYYDDEIFEEILLKRNIVF